MRKTYTIRTARLTDRQVLDLTYAIKEDMRIDSVSIYMIANLSRSITDLERNDEQVIQLDQERHAIDTARITIERRLLEVRFLRGIRIQENVQRSPSPYFDEVEVELKDRSYNRKWCMA